MQHATRFAPLALLIATHALAQPSPLVKNESDDFFLKGPVLKLKIELDPPTVEQLKKDPRKYVRVKLREEGGTAYRDVGMHLKGAAGSFRNWDDRPALTFNSDKFSKGQRFHGLDKFHLNNSVQDGTYLCEALCGDLMRQAGVPTARTSHAIVQLNDRKMGLYVLKEGYDKQFLRRYWKNASGNLYDGGFLQDINANLKNSADDGDDVKDQADLKALWAACSEPDHAQRFTKVSALLDVDRFFSLVALEVIMWHWDGYAMKQNNYRVYHDPESNKLTFIAHGMDQMFQSAGDTIEPGWSGRVCRKLMETPEGKRRYRERVREIMKTVATVPAAEERIDFYVNRVRPVLEGIDKNWAKQFVGEANNLKSRVKARFESVNKQVGEWK